ncbi:MAG: M20/M25/M40 family metallo-hydrolase [Bacteroidota bacterium]|nr:M20/M25/M40 family metallo-hydrolase [Bacteroidota bacterium]MDP4233929.1 M20/M25/M40 family metallo-hydrolase [Bacteroidota bacterium]MDP4242820.1 M20/M25/M40 family metallo-hydrolase [Bacteroidota bacterium]MDP4288298.1 M20/M25/M40 family metallo-hydrolase [Bacteroidota bacterium]
MANTKPRSSALRPPQLIQCVLWVLCVTWVPWAAGQAPKVKTSAAITAHDVMERESILASDSLAGRRTGEPGAEKAARYISSEFQRIGLSHAGTSAEYEQPFDFSEHALDTSKHEHTRAMNVIGLIRGTDPRLKDESVVIGAHYDHLGMGGPFALDTVHAIHYGADDNASGVTGLLEIAENLREGNIKPKRDIIFIAFSGEEEGLFGSAYYTEHPITPLTKVQAMLNMDMIGRMQDSTLILEGVGTSPVFRGLVDSLNAPATLHLKYFQKGTGPSDHAKFYSKDVPVLFFFTGFHPDYHKATDTKEKINADGEVRVAKFVESILLDLANRPDKIPFSRPAGDTEQKAASFSVYVGGVPDYGYDGDGLRISDITENSPAEIAGLAKGDVIILVGDMTIHTIYDYTNALAKHKPGDLTNFKVLRNGKEVVVPVVFGSRAKGH